MRQATAEQQALPYQFPGRLINQNESIVLMGSCFSERIGQRLLDNNYEVYPSVFGTPARNFPRKFNC
ncbi:MAG: hypothetical protein ACPF8V_00195 [Luteibaculum sp.]